MKQKQLKNFFLITILIVATGVAMAYSSKITREFIPTWNSGEFSHPPVDNKILMATGHLIQNKVQLGSAGTVGLNLTLQTEETPPSGTSENRNVDMVVVLDRSGSMKGSKIENARRAVRKLLSDLTADDRFALVTYSDRVQIASGLLHVTDDNRVSMISAVNAVQAGGGTNLGAGLQTGIDIFQSLHLLRNAAKVVLISDGLANKGITDVRALAAIAGIAAEKEFSVSTVGVGLEFDEHLMTAIADRGTGNYYYLENPAAFAEIFRKEFDHARTVIIDRLKVEIPIERGIRLVDAGGYPIYSREGCAYFYPGNLKSGQTRKLFLTLQVPTNTKRTYEIGNIIIRYHHNNQVYVRNLDEAFKIACIEDEKKVYSSIDKTHWAERFLKEDFNRLKQEVAADIKAGKKQKALNKINKYYEENKAVNSMVGSGKVAEHLDTDLNQLEIVVRDSFLGAPAEMRQKQKSNAKALQYEGYRDRRQ